MLRKISKRGLVVISFILVVVLFCFNGYQTIDAKETKQATNKKSDTRVIPNGITIGDIDVSGMTVDEADKAISNSFSVYDDINFVLNANNHSIQCTGKDLSICAKNASVTSDAAQYGQVGNIAERFKANQDIEAGRGKKFKLSISANRKQLKKYLKDVAKEVNDPASDNTLVRENGEFVFKEGNSGVVLLVNDATNQIADYITYDWDRNDATFDLPTTVKEPRGTQEELACISDLLGTYSTDFSSSAAARANNVSNGARLINGTILFPGDEFSVLDTITPFSEENGYQLAGSYENGTTVETYGGGICQVSSTLYGAVRAAELETVTRSCHSMVVNYVQPSQDAAISESGSKDFQIKNNKNYPVYIEGYTSDGQIYFNIFGKEEDDASHSVDYETEITEVKIQDTTWVADEALPLGKCSTSTSGHTGYKARLWKIIYENGEEKERYVYNNSTYNPSNRTVRVGVGCDDVSVKGAMINAVATQDAHTIASTIAVLAPGVSTSFPFTITPKYSVTVDEDATAEDKKPTESESSGEATNAAGAETPENSVNATDADSAGDGTVAPTEGTSTDI